MFSKMEAAGMVSQTTTRRLALGNGSGRSSHAFAREKSAVAAPIQAPASGWTGSTNAVHEQRGGRQTARRE